MLVDTGVNFVAAEAESCKSETDFVYHKPEHATWPQGFALKHAAKSHFNPLAQVPVSLTISSNAREPKWGAAPTRRAQEAARKQTDGVRFGVR